MSEIALNFHVVTLFPDLITSYCQTSIIGRGVKAGRLGVQVYNPRDFATDSYHKVDDTPYGGGAGMVLKPEPFFACVESIVRPKDSPVILMAPQGKTFNQRMAENLSKQTDITFLCGHYEGFDERIRSLVSEEISMGDFVLTGGELPALTIIDAVGRLIPGVLGKSISLSHESFNDGLLEGPHYTKPADFRGMMVPDVLLSGNHALIAKYRREEQLRMTFLNRPDLLEREDLVLDNADKKFLRKLQEGL